MTTLIKPSSKFTVDLRKLNFGNDAAEGDKNLKHAFVINAALESVIFGNTTLILGPKGSGKSAIFKIVLALSDSCRQLQEDADTNGDIINACFTAKENIEIQEYKDQLKDKFIIKLNETHNLDAYKFITDQKGSNEPDKFKLFWLIYMAVLVAKRIVEESEYLAGGKDHIDRLKKLLQPFDLSSKSTGLSVIFISLLKTLNLKLGIEWKGFKFDVAHQEPAAVDSTRFEVNLYELLQLENYIISEFGKQADIYIDRIDDFYKYDKKKMQSMVQGLFLALEDLGEFENIQPIIFLRTDIYERTELEDMDKLRGKKMDIVWDTEQSLLFLSKRLLMNKEIKEIIGDRDLNEAAINLLITLFFPSKVQHRDSKGNVKIIDFQKWFNTHFQNAAGYISPRDIIHFLSESVKNEQRSGKTKVTTSPLISEKSVIKSFYTLSEAKFKDIINISGFGDVLQLIKSRNMRSFTLNKIKTTLGDTEQPNAELVRQLKVLESLGFLKSKFLRGTKESFYYTYKIAPIYSSHWDAIYD